MTRIVKRYSQEEKERMVKRMLPPENCSVSQLSIETGISKSTLATWKTRALKGEVSRKQGRAKSSLSSQEKFTIVMETYISSWKYKITRKSLNAYYTYCYKSKLSLDLGYDLA